MRADISQMISEMDSRSAETESITADLERMLDRGNRPNVAMVERMSKNSTRVVQTLDELRVFTAWLASGEENLPDDEDVDALKVSQDRFQAIQMRHGEAILRIKKALGLIP